VLARRGKAELMLNTACDPNERPKTRPAARWNAHGDAGLSIGAKNIEKVRARLIKIRS
jgi:hypothetical protein